MSADPRPSRAELVTAGLVEHDAPDADDRLDLLAFLLDEGCSLEDLIEADRAGRLVAAAADVLLRKGQDRVDREEIAELAGVDPAHIATAWRALGFADPPADARLWWPSDAETFAAFALAAELFGAERLAQFSRVLGRAASQVAEAAVAMFMTDVQGRLERDARPPIALARANVAGQTALDAIPVVFEAAFRHQVQATLQRADQTTFTAGRERALLCVGFADLVGSTELSHQLDPAGTARLAADLEQVATDTVARWSGRLVKTIGDGLLFTTTTPVAALAIAGELVDWAGADDRLRGLRAGLSAGPVVWQDGDVHGPVVSLAARLCDAAEGGQILVDAAFASERGHDGTPTLVPVGDLTLRGFATPVTAFTTAPTTDSGQ